MQFISLELSQCSEFLSELYSVWVRLTVTGTSKQNILPFCVKPLSLSSPKYKSDTYSKQERKKKPTAFALNLDTFMNCDNLIELKNTVINQAKSCNSLTTRICYIKNNVDWG